MQIIEDYCALHRIPEPDRQLPKTLSYIHSRLISLPCRILHPTEGSICCFFDFRKEKTLAFRADTDALPITEQTGLPWCSQHPGLMHACGHDGHTAILLELARRIGGQKDLPYNIFLIFQPGEEAHGGAEAICKTGILKRFGVVGIFALHLWPGLPKGQFFSRPGLLMSHSCGVKAEFTGNSVHIASWQKGVDALMPCCAFCLRAEKETPGLLKFGKIHGGSAENILCGRVTVWGSLRSLEDAGISQAKSVLRKLCKEVAETYGCQGDVSFRMGYPGVANDSDLLQRVENIYPVSGFSEPLFTAEDFSFYQQQVPGVYFLLGIGNTPPLHSNHFSFPTDVLPKGAAFFFHLAQALA